MTRDHPLVLPLAQVTGRPALPAWNRPLIVTLFAVFGALLLIGAIGYWSGYAGLDLGGGSGAGREKAALSSALKPSTFERLPDTANDARVAAVVEGTASQSRALADLTPDQARARNAAIPAAKDVGAPARPFLIPLMDGVNFARALDCLTAAIYYEAANEPLAGQRAVAQVIINRSRHLAYPHTICAVVYQGWERRTGCQFSFTCDGSLRRPPLPALWQRARRVAEMALAGLVYEPVGLATHYHADYVLPYWAPTLVKQTTIGQHVFYRWPGAWGTSRSFVAAYGAAEPDIGADMQSAGLDPIATGGGLAEGNAAAAMPTARPVLMAGTPPPASPSVAPAASVAFQEKGRAYLMDRARTATPAKAEPVVGPRKSVTGGVIMPGAAAPAATPARPAPAASPAPSGN